MDSESLSFAYFLIWLNPSPTLILLPLLAEDLPVSFIWTLQSHCCLSWSCLPLITPCALNVDADDYLFSLIPDYARVLARVRFCCPSSLSLLVVGQLTLFPNRFSWGISCSVSWFVLIPAYVASYSDDVSIMTIFTYNNTPLNISADHAESVPLGSNI